MPHIRGCARQSPPRPGCAWARRSGGEADSSGGVGGGRGVARARVEGSPGTFGAPPHSGPGPPRGGGEATREVTEDRRTGLAGSQWESAYPRMTGYSFGPCVTCCISGGVQRGGSYEVCARKPARHCQVCKWQDPSAVQEIKGFIIDSAPVAVPDPQKGNMCNQRMSLLTSHVGK